MCQVSDVNMCWVKIQTHPAYQLVIGPEYVQAEATTPTVYCSQAHLLSVDDLVLGSLPWHVQVF